MCDYESGVMGVKSDESTLDTLSPFVLHCVFVVMFVVFVSFCGATDVIIEG
eukprot:m.20897 g.20897  ORF g.20897 m.20897 type:complete len:51 (+) comp13168_c0_seq1:420-572(+)